MKVKDLIAVTLPSMPMEIRLEPENEVLIAVSSLYFASECLIPKVIRDMDIAYIAIQPDGFGLEVGVR